MRSLLASRGSRRRSPVVAVWTAAAWLLPAPSAHASSPWPAEQPLPPPPRLGILVLSRDPAQVVDLEARTRSEVEAQTPYRTVPAWPPSVHVDAAAACGVEVACLVGRAEAQPRPESADPPGLDLVLVVARQQVADRFVVSARLVDRESRRTLGSAAEPASVGMSLQLALRACLARALPPESWSAQAAVEAHSEPSGAQVTVAGSRCRAPCRLRLPAGSYEVQASARGRQPATSVVHLTPGAVETLSLHLPPRRSPAQSPWFWVGVGAVVAGGVAAAAVAASSGSDEFRVRFGREPSGRLP